MVVDDVLTGGDRCSHTGRFPDIDTHVDCLLSLPLLGKCRD